MLFVFGSDEDEHFERMSHQINDIDVANAIESLMSDYPKAVALMMADRLARKFGLIPDESEEPQPETEAATE